MNDLMNFCEKEHDEVEWRSSEIKKNKTFTDVPTKNCHEQFYSKMTLY